MPWISKLKFVMNWVSLDYESNRARNAFSTWPVWAFSTGFSHRFIITFSRIDWNFSDEWLALCRLFAGYPTLFDHCRVCLYCYSPIFIHGSHGLFGWNLSQRLSSRQGMDRSLHGGSCNLRGCSLRGICNGIRLLDCHGCNRF